MSEARRLRRHPPKVKERKRTFSEEVALMDDDMMYVIDQGPMRGMRGTGRWFKEWVANYKKVATS